MVPNRTQSPRPRPAPLLRSTRELTRAALLRRRHLSVQTATRACLGTDTPFAAAATLAPWPGSPSAAWCGRQRAAILPYGSAAAHVPSCVAALPRGGSGQRAGGKDRSLAALTTEARNGDLLRGGELFQQAGQGRETRCLLPQVRGPPPGPPRPRPGRARGETEAARRAELGEPGVGAGWPSVTVGGGRVMELCDLGSDRRFCGPARPCLGQSGRRPPPPPPLTGVALIWAGPTNFRSILPGRVLSLILLFGFEQFSTLASAGQARPEVCGRSAARRTQLYFLHP